MQLATSNIKTMCPGLSDDPQQINDSRNTAVINVKLRRLNIDIAALQETRLATVEMLQKKDYTFSWQGRHPEEPRLHGVGFAVKNSLLVVQSASSPSACQHPLAK